MKKRWHKLVPQDDAYHVSVALDERRMPIPEHGHDFAEITWVNEGSGIHRINGVRTQMQQGDLVFIRPQDRHALSAFKDTPFRLENVAFPRTTLRNLRKRYFPDKTDWFWHSGEQPQMIRLDERQLLVIRKGMDVLRHAPRIQLHLDCFLLPLFRLLGAGKAQTYSASLPSWLAQALTRFEGNKNLQAGVHQLYRLAGRCPGHVARCMREHLEQTPSTWVNQRRLEYAARLLESSDLSITEIASECGFENLSYFHRLFQKAYSTSPLQYRKKRPAVM